MSTDQVLLTVLLLTATQPSTPQAPSAHELAEVTARGTQLAWYDSAAWHATDAVRALNPDDTKVSCFIARGNHAGRWTVVFGKRSPANDAFLIAYEAVQGSSQNNFEAKAVLPPRPDKDWFLRASSSLETVRTAFHKEDPRPYNIAVLPAPSGEWYVYAYPATITPGVWPLGGDTRFTVSQDGNTIITTRQLHRSIIEYSKPTDLKTVNGGYHTHVFHCIPEDTDILAVLSGEPKYPELVVCDPFSYEINVDGTISFLGLTKEWLSQKDKKSD